MSSSFKSYLVGAVLLTTSSYCHASLDGVAKALASGDSSAAMSRFEALSDAERTSFQGRLLEAETLVAMGKKSQAEQLYLRLIQKSPQRPEPYNNLAVLYAEKGQQDKALEFLEKAMQTNATYATVRDNLSRIYLEKSRSSYAKALRIEQQDDKPRLLALYQPSVVGSPGSQNPVVSSQQASAGGAPSTVVATATGKAATGYEVESGKIIRDRAEQARLEKARAEQARVEKALEQQEKAREEEARIAQEKAEQARLEKARAEQERLEKARAEQATRLAEEKAEQARLKKEQEEQARLEKALAEQAERARLEKARAEMARIKQEQAEKERAEQARLEKAQAEQARLEKARTVAVSTTGASGGGSDSERETVLQAVNRWARAWQEQKVAVYLAAYGREFVPPDGLSRKDWEMQRHRRLRLPEKIEVGLESVNVDFEDPSHAQVNFIQRYRSDRYRDKTKKRLQLVKHKGLWQIQEEVTLEVLD